MQDKDLIFHRFKRIEDVSTDISIFQKPNGKVELLYKNIKGGVYDGSCTEEVVTENIQRFDNINQFGVQLATDKLFNLRYPVKENMTLAMLKDMYLNCNDNNTRKKYNEAFTVFMDKLFKERG